MKRSEMVKALQDRFNTSDVDAIADLADEIIGFLEQQGMLPPSAIFVIDWDRWDPDKKEWYPSKERIHSNKWEDEE